MGVALFVRRARGLALTPEGEVYWPDVSAAFATLRAASEELFRSQGGHVLTLSVTPTLAAKWLEPRLPAFRVAHPGIELRISTSMRMVDFARERMDMAIRYGLGNWPGLRSDRLAMTDHIFPVCGPALLRSARTLRKPVDLTAHTLLFVDYQRSEWSCWLNAAGMAPPDAQELLRRGLVFDVAYMALEAAIDGQGVALGYAPFVEADLAAGRLVAPFRLTLPCTAGFDAYLGCPTPLAQAPEVSAFREWLLGAA